MKTILVTAGAGFIGSNFVYLSGEFTKTLLNYPDCIGLLREKWPSSGIKLTIQWYKDHMDWMKECTSGEYQYYYKKCMGIDSL